MCQKKVVAFTVLLWLIGTVFFYNLRYTYKAEWNLSALHTVRRPKTWTPLIPQSNVTEDFLINTPGCKIPNFTRFLKFKEHKPIKQTCYERVVVVEKTSEDEITFRIDGEKKYVKKNQRLQCSYQFAHRERLPNSDSESLSYTNLKSFKNGTIVKQVSEIVVVECDIISTKNYSILISNFKDAYLILKKKPVDDRKEKIKKNMVLATENWNVLIVGMDTMSRARAYNSLPKTVDFLKKHHWLDYRGYHKVAFNTFPNTMAILAGINASAAYKYCAQGMDQCRHRFIWEKFREAGYITAFGEDYLRLPDTFAPYKGFTMPPTDHYARHFFLAGEYTAGNIICTKNKPSGRHLIEYASQFAKAYKNDTFFGYFWINSYSHNLINLPNLFEDTLLEFFKSLNSSGTLDNTFVLFLSDHGIRFGEMRLPKDSFYEERMPMLFMWIPYEFRETYPIEYYNLQLNQYRVISPYNLHATLWKLMQLTNKDVDVIAPEACPRCKSLTEEVPVETTCRSAHIDEKWCSCHDLTNTEKSDATADMALRIAVEHVQNITRSVETKKCMECIPLKFNKLLRSHRYVSLNKTYYIIAFAFSPNNLAYEATVEYFEGNFKILDPTDTISPYNNKGYCVVKAHKRAYCVCRSVNKCNKYKKAPK